GVVVTRGASTRTATASEASGAAVAETAMAETAGAGCAAGTPLQPVQIAKLIIQPNLNPSEVVMWGGRATPAPSANLRLSANFAQRAVSWLTARRVCVNTRSYLDFDALP